MAMKLLSQSDPTWASVVMHPALFTIKEKGCTLSCISMASSYFGCYLTPKQLLDSGVVHLTDKNYVGGPGMILWDSLAKSKVLNFRLEKRLNNYHEADIVKSLKDPLRMVLLQVEGRHWVVAMNKIPLTKVYTIADPANGKKRLSSVYKSITGSAHLIRK